MKKFRFLLLLVPLALFISLLDNEVLKGFLSTGKTLDHYGYIGVLVVAVVLIIFFVLQFDKKTNS
ncbi:MAG: hypothetical protein P8H38_06875 [Flavobacteriaceae bacterium]|nr:hypothetical protein [Flavobacteriaceae bacterium]